MISAKIDLIDKDVVQTLTADLSPDERRRLLAGFAREQLADAQEVNLRALGRVPDHETIVDGMKGASIGSVRPEGVIVFDFNLLTDLFAWIGEQLIMASPVLTGSYRDSHLFFADGVEVNPGGEVPQASEYLFLSNAPYSGKIERGQSAQAPDGVYQSVAALASRRFGNSARIRFTYRSLTGTRARSDRRPAIVITVQ